MKHFRVLTIAVLAVLLQLLVASAAMAAPADQTYVAGWYHVVEKGESLHSIGYQYGIHAYAIADVNGLHNPDLIYAGQVLYIPAPPPGHGQDGCYDDCSEPTYYQHDNCYDDCYQPTSYHEQDNCNTGCYETPTYYQDNKGCESDCYNQHYGNAHNYNYGYGYDQAGYYYDNYNPGQNYNRYSYTCGYNYNCY